MKSSTRAFIFDLDGVLVSSAELHWYAFRKTFAAEGKSFSREEYLRVGIGVAREQVIRSVLGELPEDKLRMLMAEKERYVHEYLQGDGLDPIPGSLEFLNRVLKRKLLTAVATASRTPRLFLEAIGAIDRFKVILDRQSCQRPKPHPDIYLLAAESLGVEPDECIVVEDSPTGIQAARAAGMRTLAVTTTHPRGELTAATAVFDSFEGIDLDDWVE